MPQLPTPTTRGALAAHVMLIVLDLGQRGFDCMLLREQCAMRVVTMLVNTIWESGESKW